MRGLRSVSDEISCASRKWLAIYTQGKEPCEVTISHALLRGHNAEDSIVLVDQFALSLQLPSNCNQNLVTLVHYVQRMTLIGITETTCRR